MANNIQALPTGPYNPLPDLATLAENLVKVGVHISSSALLSALRPWPCIIAVSDAYIQYAFSVALFMIFLFGVGMIRIGWKIADDPTRYAALGRAVTRASHVVLVFTTALCDAASRSAVSPNNIKK